LWGMMVMNCKRWDDGDASHIYIQEKEVEKWKGWEVASERPPSPSSREGER
jgi:hypothetical protein